MICIIRRFNPNFDQTIVPLCSNREFGNSAINLILIVEMVERFLKKKKKKKLCNIFMLYNSSNTIIERFIIFIVPCYILLVELIFKFEIVEHRYIIH